MRNQVKEWHTCGECKHWDDTNGEGRLPIEVPLDDCIVETMCSDDPDMEACSSFEPKKGWRE